jgi:hypothetical protein
LIIGVLSFSASAEPPINARTGFIECGRTQIRARAECYEPAFCASETLSFSRYPGRNIVPVHGRSVAHEVAGAKLRALEYRAQSWACLRGKHGGHYLVVVMARAAGGTCAECEYSRMYDLNGRVIATDRDEPGRELMHKVLGGPGPHAFSDVYR